MWLPGRVLEMLRMLTWPPLLPPPPKKTIPYFAGLLVSPNSYFCLSLPAERDLHPRVAWSLHRRADCDMSTLSGLADYRPENL